MTRQIAQGLGGVTLAVIVAAAGGSVFVARAKREDDADSGVK